jgi:Sulfate permease and related transporters (MFS superfamily)
MSNVPTEHLLFLTGKLAEKRLNRVLESMQPSGFTYEVRNIGVSVAALMTAKMLLRRLSALEGIHRIMVPGLCRGDLEQVSQQTGIPVLRGPEDLKDIPAFFGRVGMTPDLSRHDVRLFAEITDAPLVSIPEILRRADRYTSDGADVIDIGCLPDTPFPHLEEAILALHAAGYLVSIDSLEDEDLLRGGRAGADYLLSLKESTLWIADRVQSIPVLIPEPHTDLPSLYRSIEEFSKRGRPFLVDSILDPVHFGFTESIIRYHELRKHFPDVEIMMGIGNLTELTEADTTGINAMLFGIISELHITNVLTTEVSPHARSAVREADWARRIMYAAREEGSLPKGLDQSLLTTHSRKPFPYSAAEIGEIAAEISDPSYRIMVSEEGIHVFNRDGMVVSDNPFDLFPRLELLKEDAPHAFYMGVELAKAQIAFRLGKRFIQDEELDWGAAAPPASREAVEATTRAAHNLKERDMEYKKAGSTLEAGKQNKRKKKKAS